MDQLEHRTIVTKPYNLTYSYYLSPNFNEKLDKSTPTLVFNHGFPDMAEMWAGALPHMLKLPYPFLLMDLLGFGDTSKPTETEKYNYRQQADSIAQILDKEGVPNNVIPIGHDWGSAVSQRFFLYHRQRCVGLSLISLAYQIPSPEPFSLDGSDEATTKRFGYPQWEYWNFFTGESFLYPVLRLLANHAKPRMLRGCWKTTLTGSMRSCMAIIHHRSPRRTGATFG